MPSAFEIDVIPDSHTGFVAGRYRDGAYSDIWTDVRRCASRTFTAYAPACSCGWRGAPRPVSDIAYLACRRDGDREHPVEPSPGADVEARHRSVPCAQLSQLATSTTTGD